MTKYEKIYYEQKSLNGMLSSLDFMTILQHNLFEQGLDTIVTLGGTKVTLEVKDIQTDSTVAVTTGFSLEEAYAKLLGVCAGSVRDVKTRRYNGLSDL
jgi:hypothetical protein